MRVASEDTGSQEGVIVTSISPGYENEYMLICIFAPFLTQFILKL
jgi:hypothetical protein